MTITIGCGEKWLAAVFAERKVQLAKQIELDKEKDKGATFQSLGIDSVDTSQNVAKKETAGKKKDDKNGRLKDINQEVETKNKVGSRRQAAKKEIDKTKNQVSLRSEKEQSLQMQGAGDQSTWKAPKEESENLDLGNVKKSTKRGKIKRKEKKSLEEGERGAEQLVVPPSDGYNSSFHESHNVERTSYDKKNDLKFELQSSSVGDSRGLEKFQGLQGSHGHHGLDTRDSQYSHNDFKNTNSVTNSRDRIFDGGVGEGDAHQQHGNMHSSLSSNLSQNYKIDFDSSSKNTDIRSNIHNNGIKNGHNNGITPADDHSSSSPFKVTSSSTLKELSSSSSSPTSSSTIPPLPSSSIPSSSFTPSAPFFDPALSTNEIGRHKVQDPR